MILIILAVGKLREAHFRAGVSDYLERIRKMLPIEQIEVASGAGEENGKGAGTIQKEAMALERHLKRDGLTVALDPQGKTLNTEEFARWLQDAMNRSASRVTFVIGGAWGLSKTIAEQADLRLSLSPMTFSHELARLVLTEQIYRALSLWKGLPYHK